MPAGDSASATIAVPASTSAAAASATVHRFMFSSCVERNPGPEPTERRASFLTDAKRDERDPSIVSGANSVKCGLHALSTADTLSGPGETVVAAVDLAKLNWVSATEAARLVRDGRVSSQGLVQ